jgi:hypothetical protein
MKMFSLVLPQTAFWRYVSSGRKAIGFVGGVLCTKIFGATDPVGVNTPLSTDVATDSTASVTMTKRIYVLTHAAAPVTAYLPPVAGDVRDVTVIKQGANDVTVTKDAGDAANIVKSPAGNGDTATVTTATLGRFLSDGTYWYRVA